MNDSFTSFKILHNVKPGDKITSFFVIRKIELKSRKDGSSYLHLELGDASGRITANLWDDIENQYAEFQPGVIVKVNGTVQTYKSIIQLSINKIRKCDDKDNVEPAMFIPSKGQDISYLIQKLNEKIDSVKDKYLHLLLEKIFSDDKIIASFSRMAGGKLWHHAYVGGLPEHTLSVASVCETMAAQYPEVNRDMLITGALLHDIGKIFEYSFDKGFIDFTDYGRLVGHISIGAHFVADIIDEINKDTPFPDEIKYQVMHLILSHQGKFEHGSPVLPATIEAMILYYADEMDSKANALTHIIERDGGKGRQWSQYITLLDRFIYLPNNQETNTVLDDNETISHDKNIGPKIPDNSASELPGTLFDIDFDKD